jgi:hypothetical protein
MNAHVIRKAIRSIRVPSAAALSKQTLLILESALTIPVFIVSWLVCAVGFSALAGFRMAKADSAQKEKILDGVLGNGKP